MQTQIQLNLGPALMPDFVTGALFQAILAWPTSSEAVQFHRVSEELIAGVVRLTKAEDPASVRFVMNEWPQVNWPSIEVRSQKSRPAFGSLRKRLDQRMAAARAGIGKVHKDIFGVPADLPLGMTALSIDQLCRQIKSDVFIDDPENIEKLVWRKSLPILHVAMAVQLLLAARYQGRQAVGLDLQDIDFYREAVQLAGLLETSSVTKLGSRLLQGRVPACGIVEAFDLPRLLPDSACGRFCARCAQSSEKRAEGRHSQQALHCGVIPDVA